MFSIAIDGPAGAGKSSVANPASLSWAVRLRARSSAEAVKKIFSWARGRITVPISRPSITTSWLAAICCCSHTSFLRTAG